MAADSFKNDCTVRGGNYIRQEQSNGRSSLALLLAEVTVPLTEAKNLYAAYAFWLSCSQSVWISFPVWHGGADHPAYRWRTSGLAILMAAQSCQTPPSALPSAPHGSAEMVPKSFAHFVCDPQAEDVVKHGTDLNKRLDIPNLEKIKHSRLQSW